MTDFSLISYVNLIYKLVIKISTDRIDKVSTNLIQPDNFYWGEIYLRKHICNVVWIWEEESF